MIEASIDALRGACAAFGLMLACSCQAAGIDVKGIALGADERILVEALRRPQCPMPNTDDRFDRVCFSLDETFGGAPASIYVGIIGASIAFVSIEVESSSFQEVVGALTAKLGAPSKKQKITVTTRFGTTLDNQVMIWKRGPDVLVARQYDGTLEKASFTLSSDSARKEIDKHKKDASKVRAADL